ncbi:hypothetical protein TNCV_1223011 [Trichonephila clavipes]|nr:hypothetical protein TNCV_1223011 [Trichonephila clavipes]
MSWKLCKKSSFGMDRFVGCQEYCQISSFKASLSCGKRKKSRGLRSGKNGGCSICTFFQEVFVDIGRVRVSIVVNKIPRILLCVLGHGCLTDSRLIHSSLDIIHTVNRRSFGINFLTFSMFSSLTEFTSLLLRVLSETLSQPSRKRTNYSYTHFMESA